MDIKTRQDGILELLRVRTQVEVEDLTRHFSVTRQTIRADLRNLEDRGLLSRTHGGAVHVETVSNREYGDRRRLQRKEKEAMGKLAAGLIPDASSVTLNIGTTTEQVAKALANHRDLTVVSNNINVIHLLMGSNQKELVLVGGAVRQSDGAIVGEDAVEFIARYKVDFAIVGASALDSDGAVLDFDAREVSVARAILRNSRTRILVCDGTKFDRSAPVRICDVADLDYVVTDVAPPAEFAERARAAQTEILIVDEHDGPENP